MNNKVSIVMGTIVAFCWWSPTAVDDTAEKVEPTSTWSRRADTQLTTGRELRAPSVSSDDDAFTVQQLRDLDTPSLLRVGSNLNGHLMVGILAGLNERPRDEVTEEIRAAFREAGSNNPALRERSIWLAGRFNSPEMVDLWRDVLLRTPPGSAAEVEHGSDITEQPVMPFYMDAIATEMMLAADYLGELSHTQPRARELLHRVVDDSSPDRQFPTLVREQAAMALVRQNRNNLLGIVSRLDRNDPLRAALRSFYLAARMEGGPR